MLIKKIGIFSLAALGFYGPAFAQDTDTNVKVWSGEGAVSAGFTTGNTETSDVSIGAKIKREYGAWVQNLELLGEFGEADGVETRNRQSASFQADRKLSEKLSVFGKANIVQDEFSGFENRAFVGAGMGYIIQDSDRSYFDISAAIGYQYDKTRGTSTVMGESEGNVGVNLGYDYHFTLNENVKYTNNAELFYSEVSTQIVSVSAITSELAGGFSLRASLETRYDTNPPEGFEDTDTTTRLSVVYGF